MKPRAFKPSFGVALGLWMAASLALGAVRAGDEAVKAATSPSPSAKAEATPKVKRPKQPRDTGDPSLPPKTRKAKSIDFPAPIGQPSHDVKIPSIDSLGKVLSVIEAATMTAIDKDHAQIEGGTFKLNGPDGNEDYRVEMPVSVINLQTDVITSDHPVTVRTKDFELTGEKMEFNTVDRTGELRGHVHMRIHNLKQTIAPGNNLPAPK